MFDSGKAGKIVGALFLTQMAAGIFLNFFLLGAVTKDPLNLATEPAMATTLGVGLLVALVISSFNLIAAAICYRIFQGINPIHSLIVVALACVGLGLTAVEYASVMELFSWSRSYAAATDPEAKAFLESLRPMVVAGRNTVHFMAIGLSGFGLTMLYLLLFRSSSVPKPLMGFGVFAAAMQVIAVSHTFFGLPIPFLFLLPLMVAQLVLPAWFIMKGISPRDMAGT